MKRLTQQQHEDCNNAKTCHFSEKLLKANESLVKDHDHLTSEYRGPWHTIHTTYNTKSTNT